MIALVSNLPTIQQNGLSSSMVPGQPAYIEDISYWIPDIAKTRNLIAQNMGITLNETAQKECGIVCKENGTEQIEKVTEEEWKLLKQYRNLCEESRR